MVRFRRMDRNWMPDVSNRVEARFVECCLVDRLSGSYGLANKHAVDTVVITTVHSSDSTKFADYRNAGRFFTSVVWCVA